MDGKERGRKLRELVFSHYEEANENRRPNRVRPSEAGHACRRYTWMRFRWADELKPIEGRLYRLFETGHIQEDRLVADLKAVGAMMHVKDPSDSNKQIPVEIMDGHCKGFLDGVAQSLPYANHDYVLFEAKSHNKKSFAKLQKEGAESIPKHYGQMQLYMHEHGLPEAVYAAVCKDDDDLYFEFVEYDKDYATRLYSNIKRAVMQEVPPEKLNRSPEYFECKFCSCHSVCHTGSVPERNCRTCKHASPAEEGQWSCGLHEKFLSLDEQRAGCMEHRYNTNILDVALGADGVAMVFNATGEIFEDNGPAYDGREAAE